MCCSKKCFSKRDKLAHKALGGIKQEMRVTEWIKQHRITNHVLRKMHSEQEWQELESKFDLTQVQVTDDSENDFGKEGKEDRNENEFSKTVLLNEGHEGNNTERSQDKMGWPIKLPIIENTRKDASTIEFEINNPEQAK